MAHGAGYLLNDDRASGGVRQEADVRVCPHCQTLLVGTAWQAQAGFCAQCAGPLCGPCATRMLREGCRPFKDRVDAALTRLARQRAYAMTLGV